MLDQQELSPEGGVNDTQIRFPFEQQSGMGRSSVTTAQFESLHAPKSVNSEDRSSEVPYRRCPQMSKATVIRFVGATSAPAIYKRREGCGLLVLDRVAT